MVLMKQYIQYVADRLLLMFGIETIYNVENPFEWMELISVQGINGFLIGGASQSGKKFIDILKNCYM